MFYNYKQFFSILLQAVTDADYKFLVIDAGAYGKLSDGGIFRNSDLFKCSESNAFDEPTEMTLPRTFRSKRPVCTATR